MSVAYRNVLIAKTELSTLMLGQALYWKDSDSYIVTSKPLPARAVSFAGVYAPVELGIPLGGSNEEYEAILVQIAGIVPGAA